MNTMERDSDISGFSSDWEDALNKTVVLRGALLPFPLFIFWAFKHSLFSLRCKTFSVHTGRAVSCKLLLTLFISLSLVVTKVFSKNLAPTVQKYIQKVVKSLPMLKRCLELQWSHSRTLKRRLKMTTNKPFIFALHWTSFQLRQWLQSQTSKEHLVVQN